MIDEEQEEIRLQNKDEFDLNVKVNLLKYFIFLKINIHN
jgi:hypothetical protein